MGVALNHVLNEDGAGSHLGYHSAEQHILVRALRINLKLTLLIPLGTIRRNSTCGKKEMSLQEKACGFCPACRANPAHRDHAQYSRAARADVLRGASEEPPRV